MLKKKEHAERRQPRSLIRTEIELTRGDLAQPILAQSKDLSWGGACLQVPRRSLNLDDSVVVKFPWRKGKSFSAGAEVVWTQPVDHRQSLVGVSFSMFRVRDLEKLQRVLSMLTRANPDQQDIPFAERLEIRFLDREDMFAVLEQIRFGCVETTVFRSFQINERILLVLNGFSDMPNLQLRARVLWQKAFGSEEGPTQSGMYQVAFALEHPADDLKRVTDPLIRWLGEKKGG